MMNSKRLWGKVIIGWLLLPAVFFIGLTTSMDSRAQEILLIGTPFTCLGMMLGVTMGVWVYLRDSTKAIDED